MKINSNLKIKGAIVFTIVDMPWLILGSSLTLAVNISLKLITIAQAQVVRKYHLSIYENVKNWHIAHDAEFRS